jgi:3-oxoacyl-[acyl-carrier-protein] synthase-3
MAARFSNILPVIDHLYPEGGQMPPKARLGIKAAAYHLPGVPRTIDEWAALYSESPERIARLRNNGVEKFFDSDNALTENMAAHALQKLIRDNDVDPASIDLLIFAHTGVGANGPPLSSVARALKARFQLSRAQFLSISQQNCVSILTALRVAHAIVESRKTTKTVLVVSADQIQRSIGYVRAIGDVAIHSDVGSALLLSTDNPENRLLSISSFATGKRYSGTLRSMEPDEAFYFSAIGVMRRALREAGLKGGDVGAVLPNHVNRPAWGRMLDYLRIPHDRLFDANFASKGHAFGSDWIINFVDHGPSKGPLLAFSNGLSGCFGAAVIS